MSNVITVVSAVTGREVASVNTGETTLREAINKALTFREVSNADVHTRIALEDQLRNAWNAATDQEIRSQLLRSVGIDKVTVKVGVTSEDAPAELVEAEAPAGLDVVVNSAVLNAPIADFNTTDYTLTELKAEAMQYPEVRNSSVSTQLGLIATAQEVLAATEGKTFTNEHLSAVGIASVVVGDGGAAPETPETVSETPIHDELVSESADKPLTLDKPVQVAPVPAPAPAPAKFVDTPLSAVPVTKTVTKWRGLSNKVAAAVAVAAGVVGAIIGGSIF